jgi:type IV pilus assembly protein PilC
MNSSRSNLIVLFTRQLATMISSKLPVDVAVDIISTQGAEGEFREVLRKVRDDLRGGNTLAEALVRHPGWFSGLYTTLVKVGDKDGTLDAILQRLAAYLEATAAFKAKILDGTLVPAVAAAIAGLAGLYLLGASGPVTAVLAVVLCTAPAIVVLAVLPTGRFLPVMRSIMKRVEVARFARILGTLQRCGVTLIDGLEVTAGNAFDPSFASALRAIGNRLRGGERSLAVVMKETGVFPPMVSQMVGAGEETGKLDDMLFRVADFYDAECEAAVERLNGIAATVLTFVVAAGMALLIQGWIMHQMAGRIGR